MTDKIIFNPVMGTEERVQMQTSSPGSVYFTTDTRKIYLDMNDSKIPMGGNLGLFYGNMKMTVPVSDQQKEFEFKITEIVGNEKGENLLIPNVDDLILNQDGCFYKVLSSDGEGIDTLLNTEKLTIAGTGGGNNSSTLPDGSQSQASFRVGKFEIPNRSVLVDKPCLVKFVAKSTNDVGEYIEGEIGYYELYINRVKKEGVKGIIKGIPSGEITDNLESFEEKYINTIDIGPYLPVATSVAVKIVIFDDSGVQQAVRDFSVEVSSMDLTWNYDQKTLNEYITGSKESMTLSWSVSGANLEKITYITVGDSEYPYEIARGTNTDFEYELNFKQFNMLHGAHTVKMWAVARVGTEDIPTDPIYKNIIVAKDEDPTTIISFCLFEKELTQYTTISAPIYIYNRHNVGTAVVSLIENGSLKDEWSQVPNLGADENKNTWSYTPTISGDAIMLTVQSGGQEKTITVAVQGIDIDLSEKTGYAFKFKSTDFSSNSNVQNWKTENNKYNLSFSDNFDWVNGGLKSEDDGEGGRRQYVAVKAGTTMSINYPMWKQNAPAFGKHFKFIFKATNCRNYDAQVLACKVDKVVPEIDKTVEYFWLEQNRTELTYGKTALVRNGKIEISDLTTATLDVTSKESQNEFSGKYVEFEGEVYQCAFIQSDPDNNPDEKYNTWYKVSAVDSFNGLLLKAQYGQVKTANESLDVHYCEDAYIELEVEVTKDIDNKRYIKFWIDGVPTGYCTYSENDRFELPDSIITIGSSDCDVYVYLAKLYESELSIDEHMNNFYADAPNAEEMVRRYHRNDIMSDSRKNEIDMYKLAEANPDILVHHYTVPKMPTTKKDETFPCSYEQYQGSKLANLRADGVMIKVQGTSSEKYVLSAANLDTNFDYKKNGNIPTGFIDTKTNTVLEDGWSMDGGTAIPIKFTCTKVNVASCENINNALNQEWYNLFQPYKSVLRCKNPNARDTMQFTNGVIFVTDKNQKVDDKKGITNNVFAEIVSNGKKYIDAPYAKMYSIGQMGNSKKNVHVFHDESNPLECCIEVGDNQMPQQWMVSDEYNHGDIGEKQKFFEFRYPDGVEDVKKRGENGQRMIDGWNNFVSWMAHSNPQPRYNKFENITTEKAFRNFAINKKTFAPIDVYVMNDERTEYTKIDGFDENITTYYTLTDHIYGYTDLVLDLPEEERTFGEKIFTGFIAENQKKENGELWQKDYTPLIRGCAIDKYAGTYTHDTYEYRMAKMLHECEDHLIMDSVLYHYLFIERHCLIDNVAKNTFWSTEDCQHWCLIKDYDNDTADGTDNQGKFTRNYGMEPTDMLNPNARVFNAHQSVWFNFLHGLDDARKWMYDKLENAKVSLDGGKTSFSVWDSEAYLKTALSWQKSIPERCWIEDYYRKYFRPNEIYKDQMFNSMLSGGQKKFQREQYETYQNVYMDSKYAGIKIGADRILFRPTGSGLKSIRIPVEVYHDCYIYSDVGGQRAMERVKRNTPAYLTCPVDELGNATMYIHPGSVFTKLGSVGASGQLGSFAPDQMSFSGAKKLRELIYATSDLSSTLNYGLESEVSFEGNNLLEKLYVANLINCKQKLNLADCTSLIELDASNSAFTEVTIAEGAPVTTIKLSQPTTLTLNSLPKLTEFNIENYGKLKTVNLHNIDKSIPNLSKTIVTEALKHVNAEDDDDTDYVQYYLTNADWVLDSADDISGQNIPILDKMLNGKYTQTAMAADKISRLPYSAAFTGKLTISKNAYDGSSPLTFYNKYITDSAFGGLDMNFESTKAKLYNVTIYDGDGLVFWSKKTTKTTLDETFLSSGPSGAFDVTALYKSPTTEFNYEFLNEWVVKDDSGNVVQNISGTIPIGMTITKNLHIYPQFKESKRSYTISVKQKHPVTGETVELVNKEFLYGTALETIITIDGNKLLPYVDDPDEEFDLLEGYVFKGYSLVPDSDILISNDNYIVRGADTLWVVFEYSKTMNTHVHPEWFRVTKVATSEGVYNEPNSNLIYSGVYIEPVSPLMGGKVTLPTYMTYEGIEYPVISINNFKNTKVTHVFTEDKVNNKLLMIAEKCFYELTSLRHFDFEKSGIRFIGNEAFRNCAKLDTNSFGKQTYYIGEHAFTQALDPEITVINVPASAVRLLSYAIANNLDNRPDYTKILNILNIGNEKEQSSLLLAQRDGMPAIDKNALKQTQKFNTINFWSTQYSSANDIITGSTTVASWFAANGVLASGGSVFVNGF